MRFASATADDGGKRQRKEEPTVEDMLYKARIVMDRDPYKERAPKDEERKFRALFGCGPIAALQLWKLLEENDEVPPGGRMIHLLWTLLFVKVYPLEETMTKFTSSDPKTSRKWILEFMKAIAGLESDVVSVAMAFILLCNSFSLCFVSLVASCTDHL